MVSVATYGLCGYGLTDDVLPFLSTNGSTTPPQNLHCITTDSMSSEWDPPGNETEDDLMYRITIPDTEKESCTGLKCTHIITADGSAIGCDVQHIL